MRKSQNIVVSNQEIEKKGINGKVYLSVNSIDNKPVSVFIKSYVLLDGVEAEEDDVYEILSKGYKVCKVFKNCLLVFKHIEIKYKSFNVISKEFINYYNENKKKATSKTT